jgi:glycosyltransferase involved in cell wall biosynthesis
MFGWEYPPHNSGGLGVACRGITRGLVDQGVSVIFVLPKKFSTADSHVTFVNLDVNCPLPGEVVVEAVDASLTPYATSTSYLNDQLDLPYGLYGPTLFAEVLRYGVLARDIARKHSFDVIHAHDWLSFLAGIEAKKISGKPLIVHVHATGFDQGGGEHADSRVYAIEKRGMEYADRIIAVSQFTKDMIAKKYFISPDKIDVVHNGIEYQTPAGRPEWVPKLHFAKMGKKVVLYVGRLTLQKGVDHFLRAARIVIEHEPNTLFVVAGSGDMEFQLIRQSAEFGIADNVLFVGFQRGPELDALYHDADLFVLPSVSEPFGLTALEAASFGTPVLLSKQSGVQEVLRHALRADFWDTDEMANKIISALRFSPLRTELAQGAKKQLPFISWSKAAKLLKSLYRKLVK